MITASSKHVREWRDGFSSPRRSQALVGDER
jgi:hypothetical protein